MGIGDWDKYADRLAVLGEWDPQTTVGRDLLAESRELPDTANVGRNALAILATTWSTLPPAVRQQILSGLKQAAEQISQGMEALDQLGDAPIVGWVVAGIQAVVQIQQGFAGVADVQRSASNYEHGNGQASTCWATKSPSHGMYEVLLVKEFAQFIRFRAGGDFDRKPCFGRKGLHRDAIFTGVSSPGDNPGKCKSEMRRGSGDSFGPFEPNKCGRSLGISALLWPWWSAAYEPMLLPRWQGSPPGASFQAGPSEDTNALLAGVQTGLLTDPRLNLASSLTDVHDKCDRFLDWFAGRIAGSVDVHPEAGGGAREMRDGFIRLDRTGQKLVDAVRDPEHISHPDAHAYWYQDAAGLIRPYPDQQGAALDAWGVMLPPGKPEGLGCTLAQHNAVISVRASFAQRRLATLRNVSLVKAAVAELGIAGIDPGARAAAEYANGLSSTQKMLPYPGELRKVQARKFMFPLTRQGTKRAFRKPAPLQKPGLATGTKVALGVGGVAGVGLIAAVASGMLPLKK